MQFFAYISHNFYVTESAHNYTCNLQIWSYRSSFREFASVKLSIQTIFADCLQFLQVWWLFLTLLQINHTQWDWSDPCKFHLFPDFVNSSGLLIFLLFHNSQALVIYSRFLYLCGPLNQFLDGKLQFTFELKCSDRATVFIQQASMFFTNYPVGKYHEGSNAQSRLCFQVAAAQHNIAENSVGEKCSIMRAPSAKFVTKALKKYDAATFRTCKVDSVANDETHAHGATEGSGTHGTSNLNNAPRINPGWNNAIDISADECLSAVDFAWFI